MWNAPSSGVVSVAIVISSVRIGAASWNSWRGRGVPRILQVLVGQAALRPNRRPRHKPSHARPGDVCTPVEPPVAVIEPVVLVQVGVVVTKPQFVPGSGRGLRVVEQ